MSGEIVPGYGRQLALAREAKGLTVAQVADKLKLTSRQVEALEAEDASRLPAPVFVRGFIRNYARLVEIALAELPQVAAAPAVPTETITARSEELRFSSSPVRRWLLLPMAVFGAFLILVAVLYAWLSQGEVAYVPAEPAETAQSVPLALPAEPAPVAPAPAPDAAAVAADPTTANSVPPAAAAPGVAPLPGQPAAPAPVAPAAVKPLQAAPVQPGLVPAAPKLGQPIPPAPAKPVAPAPGAAYAPAAFPPPAFPPAATQAATPRPVHVVQMVAESTDAWIEVVAGDDKRYSRLIRSGEQLTLRGAAPFRLVVGNAAGVRLSYDGKGIDLKPYTGDRVARLTLE
jgi:cytoskeleton protein RodZ